MDISKSLFYRVLWMEHEEVDRLKWIQSQQSGYDIGLEHARFLWARNHQKKWMREVMESGAKLNSTDNQGLTP